MVNSVIVDNLAARYNPSLLISCSALTKSRYIEAYLATNTNKTTYISIQCNIYVWSVFKQIDMCELCSPVFTQAAFIQSPTHRFRAEIRVSVIQRLQKISTPKLHSTCLRTGMNIHSSRYSENSQALEESSLHTDTSSPPRSWRDINAANGSHDPSNKKTICWDIQSSHRLRRCTVQSSHRWWWGRGTTLN